MTGNPTVDTAIAIGAGFGALIGVLIGVAFAIYPFANRIRKMATQAATKVADQSKTEANAAAAATAKTTTEEILQGLLEDARKERERADLDRARIQEQIDQIEARSAERAASDQRQINDLELKVSSLQGELRVVSIQNEQIAAERNRALLKVEEQDKLIAQLKNDQQRDRSKLHLLEVELAQLRGRSDMVDELKELFGGFINSAVRKPGPAPNPQQPSQSKEEPSAT